MVTQWRNFVFLYLLFATPVYCTICGGCRGDKWDGLTGVVPHHPHGLTFVGTIAGCCQILMI